MLPILAVLLAALCFSTTGTAQALADVDASALSIGAARVLVGGTVLGLVALNGLHRHGFPSKGPAGGAHPVPTWTVVALGTVGVLAYQPLFFAGTRMNGVAIGTVVSLGSAPLITGALDLLIRRCLPTPRWSVATAITLVGVLVVSGVLGAGGPASTVDPMGLLASAGAGGSYALLTVSSKLLLDRSWEPILAMGTIFGTAAILSVPLILLTSTGWLGTPAGVALALWLGLVTTAAAYLLFGWGLRRLAPTTVSTLSLAEPMSATLLGIVVLDEHLAPLAVLGILLIAVGLLVLGTPSRRQMRTDVERA
ncbi:MAG: DMT family transporter [Pauljensenia sp.]